ncbi:MAG: hypothetical protein HYZ75_05220 [Elusimicrobia bacterium]|nr:hypothetical protein [Elusimicrobiota bacterium]
MPERPSRAARLFLALQLGFSPALAAAAGPLEQRQEPPSIAAASQELETLLAALQEQGPAASRQEVSETLRLLKERLVSLRLRAAAEASQAERPALIDRVERLAAIVDRLTEVSARQPGAVTRRTRARVGAPGKVSAPKSSLEPLEGLVREAEVGKDPAAVLTLAFENGRLSGEEPEVVLAAVGALPDFGAAARSPINAAARLLTPDLRVPPAPAERSDEPGFGDLLEKLKQAFTAAAAPFAGLLPERTGTRVARLEPGDARESLEIDLRKVTSGLKGKERDEESYAIAWELIKELGWEDIAQDRVTPLRDWICDSPDVGTEVAAVELRAAPDGSFQKVIRYEGGRSRVERASFMASTPYRGRSEWALVLTKPIHADQDGRGIIDPRRFREYLSSGGFNQWDSTFGTTPSGWFSNATGFEKRRLSRHTRAGKASDGHWRETGSEEKDTTLTEVPGTSTFGAVGTGISDSPVVGDVLTFGWGAASSVWGSIQAAPQTLVYAATGDGRYGASAAGNWSKVAPMNWAIGTEGHRDRLNDDAWIYLLLEAEQRRDAALDQAGYTRQATDQAGRRRLLERWDGRGRFATRADCEKVYRRADCDRWMYSEAELSGSLDRFTMGGAADQLIEGAQEKAGFESVAQAGTGYALKLFDNVGETLMNPVVWASCGLGICTKAGAAMAEAGQLSTPMVFTMRGGHLAQTMLSTTLYANWMVRGTDRLGQTVVAVSEGDSEKSVKKAADFSTDLFFLGRMGLQTRAARLRRAQEPLFGVVAETVGRAASEAPVVVPAR